MTGSGGSVGSVASRVAVTVAVWPAATDTLCGPQSAWPARVRRMVWKPAETSGMA